MRLSDHFESGECIISADHPELAAKILMTSALLERAFQFVVHFWEPLRLHVNCPVIFTSGIRSKELNDATPGAHWDSDHMCNLKRRSMACDFYCALMSKAWEYIVEHRDDIKMAYWNKDKGFIHVSALDKLGLRGRLSIIERGIKHVIM